MRGCSRIQWPSLCVFLLIAVALLSACSSRFVNYGEGRYSSRYKNVVHVVQKGETLYSIAWQYGYDYRKVASWNNISAPYTIFPEQELKLYEHDEKTAVKPVVTVSEAVVEKNETRRTIQRKHKAQNPIKRKTKITWGWPTKGKIISYYSESDPGKKGLDIAGKHGQPIHAAASGVVVYSGNGLRGYGNLIIIKHNETYFSAYAHNSEIFVKENEKVKFGQKIADMGSTGTDKPMLHFEIRRDGKPSNPMKYLPGNSHEG